jgi:hypothetical protein
MYWVSHLLGQVYCIMNGGERQILSSIKGGLLFLHGVRRENCCRDRIHRVRGSLFNLMDGLSNRVGGGPADAMNTVPTDGTILAAKT